MTPGNIEARTCPDDGRDCPVEPECPLGTCIGIGDSILRGLGKETAGGSFLQAEEGAFCVTAIADVVLVA
jgi:hypothetical protein